MDGHTAAGSDVGTTVGVIVAALVGVLLLVGGGVVVGVVGAVADGDRVSVEVLVGVAGGVQPETNKTDTLLKSQLSVAMSGHPLLSRSLIAIAPGAATGIGV